MRVFDHRKLRELRRAAGISRTRLAADIDRTQDSVGLYERGRVEPRANVVAAIALRLGVPIDSLFTDKPESAA